MDEIPFAFVSILDGLPFSWRLVELEKQDFSEGALPF